jgi:hypothetical protein
MPNITDADLLMLEKLVAIMRKLGVIRYDGIELGDITAAAQVAQPYAEVTHAEYVAANVMEPLARKKDYYESLFLRSMTTEELQGYPDVP